MKEQAVKKGRLVIISGPSGVGKSTICKEVVNQIKNAYLSVSLTSRTKAENEEDGREYWFVTKKQFRKHIEEGLLLEYAEVFGNLYGTPKNKIDEALAAGRTVILEIDVQGAKQVKDLYPNAKMIFILPPSERHLVERLNGRGREDARAAAARLAQADDEVAAAWQYYKNMVVNDDLQEAVKEIIAIIQQYSGE
jgi:guanylate kinase